MCGIACIKAGHRADVPADRLLAMAAAQRHRGPDGLGYAVWTHGSVARAPRVWRGSLAATSAKPDVPLTLGLAHNLLAIQDTSEGARQPLQSQDGRLWTSFNGEIYNFIELRAELKRAGFTFHTASDTEVLLACWQYFGPACLPRLRGMFAFVIYDTDTDTLFAARDRFGIKPLYYSLDQASGTLVIASEFRGIHASGLVRRTWNGGAVRAFLAAGVNKPDERTTFFENVSELPPGCLLEMSPRGFNVAHYYALPDPSERLNGQDALDALRHTFLETVDIHLRSAREVGACMSGGLDSTNIACGVQRALGDEHTRFRAFTIGAAASEDVALARLAASQLGFQHTVFETPPEIDVADLVDMTVACETPNHWWGPINQYWLLRHISRTQDIPVLIDGQGADEVMSGYPWFVKPLLAEIGSHSPQAAEAIDAGYRSHPPLPLPVLAQLDRMYGSRRGWIETFDGGAMSAMGVTIDEVLAWPEVDGYLHDDLTWRELRTSQIQRRELQHLLRHEDRLGMWFSIENRVPFVDHELAALLFRLDPAFLLKDGFLKYPLRELFPELPDEIRWNTAKHAFWASHSRLPPLAEVVESAWADHADLRALAAPPAIKGLDEPALWRFFQMAVLWNR